MNDGFLSKDEIDSLLNGGSSESEESIEENEESIDSAVEDADNEVNNKTYQI